MKVNLASTIPFKSFQFLIDKLGLCVLSVVLFTSCNDVEDTPDSQGAKSEKEISPMYKGIQVGDSLRPIVDTLAAYYSIDDEAIGYSGSKPITYECFEKLNQFASDDELIRLTNHYSPAVRGYSFWALVERNHSSIKEIALNHAQDVAVVDRMSGCTNYPIRLNEFLLATLTNHCRNTDCRILPKDLEEIAAKIK